MEYFNKSFSIFSKQLFGFLLIVATLCCFDNSLKAQDFKGLYRQLNPSVVTILTLETIISDKGTSQGGGLGSGVLIDKEGLIFTAAHVVQSAEKIMVKTYDDQLVEAEVISSNPSADVALIKLMTPVKNIPVAKLGDSEKTEIGEQVLVIGAPYGLEHSLSIGYISGRQNRGVVFGGTQMEFFQTDAAINQGNSGGPMFNKKGEVIGIVSSILSQSGGFDGIGFVAAINPTKSILLEGSPFWTGFEGIMLTNKIAEVFNIPAKGGLLVQRVVSNSIADRAGLKGGFVKATILGQEIWVGGDIILNIQGTACDAPHNFDNIKEQLETLHPTVPISMDILRAGKLEKLTLSPK